MHNFTVPTPETITLLLSKGMSLCSLLACRSPLMTANSSSVSWKVRVRYPQSKKWYPRKLNAYGLSLKTIGLPDCHHLVWSDKKTTAINVLVWAYLIAHLAMEHAPHLCQIWYKVDLGKSHLTHVCQAANRYDEFVRLISCRTKAVETCFNPSCC